MTPRVGCVVLAAGASRRLQQPKQLLLHRGEPLVRQAATAACQSNAATCAVVVGAHATAVSVALSGLPLEIIENGNFAEGLASSIRVALAWAEQRRCSALLLALCDQPRLTTAHLDRLIRAHRGALTVASRYAGKNGVPALFPEARFAELAELRGDVGASALLNRNAPVTSVPWPEGELDVDTPEAARRLIDPIPEG